MANRKISLKHEACVQFENNSQSLLVIGICNENN